MKITKYIIWLVTAFAVVYPLWVRSQSVYWAPSSFIATIFPFLGILAFTLLWTHSICGVFESWLQKYINMDLYVAITAKIILLCIILHPLLALVTVNFNLSNLYLAYGFLFIELGAIGWTLLIIYDVAKPFLKYEAVKKQWNNILTISTVGFIIIFFHSLFIGSDLQTGFLRTLWIFYGVTGILATVYTYGIKRFLFKKPS